MRRLLALLLPALPASAAEPPFWQRAWVVAEVICPRCDPAMRAGLQSTLGVRITLGAAAFDNPLYTGCPAGADYADLRPRPRVEVEAAFRPDWAVPALREAGPVAGMVRCATAGGPPNRLGLFVFEAPDRGWYRFEARAVLRLSPADAPTAPRRAP